MSAFDTNAPNPGEVITENFLDHLVGEGKKFADPEAMARGKYESDRHVTNLEKQLAELKEDLDKATQMDEMMELIRNQQRAPVEPVAPVVDPSQTGPDQMTPEALKAIVENHVSERDRQKTEARNVAEADKVLTEKFGDSAGTIVNTRANELGMSVDAMKEMASKNPKAFLRLVGVDATKGSPPGNLLGNNQRSEGGPITNANTRDSKYYSKMRKENKGDYYRPQTQAQMMKDREEMGEAFYGNS